jgi:SAM-dependent methyltransferase
VPDGEPSVDRLTDRSYWDAQYDPTMRVERRGVLTLVKHSMKRVLGPRILSYLRDYPTYLFLTVIYPRYVPDRKGARALEVGSAPGTHLLELHEAFGVEPFGVEYAPRGAEVNRELFRRHGVDPANVIETDFLSSDFQTTYRGCFDIVVSFGFIEHFTDVGRVVASHVNVLAPGGHLVVSIPNLRGLNYALQWFFQKELLQLHNRSIMDPSKFCELFEGTGLRPLFCGYHGTFNFNVFDTRVNSEKRRLLALCTKAQLVLNAAFRILFPAGGAEHKYLSPHLIFIGQKEP